MHSSGVRSVALMATASPHRRLLIADAAASCPIGYKVGTGSGPHSGQTLIQRVAHKQTRGVVSNVAQTGSTG